MLKGGAVLKVDNISRSQNRQDAKTAAGNASYQMMMSSLGLTQKCLVGSERVHREQSRAFIAASGDCF